MHKLARHLVEVFSFLLFKSLFCRLDHLISLVDWFVHSSQVFIRDIHHTIFGYCKQTLDAQMFEMKSSQNITSMSLLVYLYLYLLLQCGWLYLPANARCINWCNQRGVCTAPDESGTCDCTIGYGNEDCGTKLCPKGFDPLTIVEYTNRRTISLTTGSTSGKLDGQLVFSMGPESVNIPIGITKEKCSVLLSKNLTYFS